MNDNTKPLAKSLHTVTVLVRLARHVDSTETGFLGWHERVTRALEILGYPNDTQDPHGLVQQALKQLNVTA